MSQENRKKQEKEKEKMSTLNWFMLSIATLSALFALLSVIKADKANDIAESAVRQASLLAEREENYNTFWDAITIDTDWEKDEEGRILLTAKSLTGALRSVRLMHFEDEVLISELPLIFGEDLNVHESHEASISFDLTSFLKENAKEGGAGDTLYAYLHIVAEGFSGGYDVITTVFWVDKEENPSLENIRHKTYRSIDRVHLYAGHGEDTDPFVLKALKDNERLCEIVEKALRAGR